MKGRIIGAMNKHVTERIDDAERVANPADVLTRVQAEGIAPDITRRVAAIERRAPLKPPTSAELDAALARGPRLDPDDADDFLKLIEQIRREAVLPERSPWD